MHCMLAAALVAATLVGGAAVMPMSAAAATAPVGGLEASPPIALIQYGYDDDDWRDRRRRRYDDDDGYDRRYRRRYDDDYDYRRYRRPPRYGIHPRRICRWRERRVWTHYGWRWRPVRVCRTSYW
jgi:hypothetical protein